MKSSRAASPHRVQPSGIATLLLLLLTTASALAQDWIYTVRPGDNIWNLTAEYLADMRYWQKLQALNQIGDPEHIPPGSRLRIPIAWLKRQPAAVRVIAVQGKAEATLAATGETIPLTIGTRLRSGDEVRSGPESSVTLEFADGSRLLLQADSRLVMDTLSAYGESGMVDTRLRLQSGRADSRVTPRWESGPRYEISTPAAVSAVRGTRFRVGAEDQAVTRTEVLEGKVGVSGGGRTRLVPAQFGTLTKAGIPPIAPVKLLPAPDLSALPRLVERVPIQLTVPPLAGAVALRAQIAPNEEFNTLLFDGLSTPPQIKGPDLPDGDYTLRVRGIDLQGLEGLDAYHRFTLNARPEPPFLIAPPHNTIVYDKPAIFQWSEPQQAVNYHFQLADNASFTAPLIDIRDHRKSHLATEQILKPGSYYWRVATRDSAGKEGPFSDLQNFKLQPSPKVAAPTVEENMIVFRWSGFPGQRYEFQIARDSEFEEVIFTTSVAEPQVRMPRPPSGLYYLRIRASDAEGAVGSYGPTQRINIPPESYWPLVFVAILVAVLAL